MGDYYKHKHFFRKDFLGEISYINRRFELKIVTKFWTILNRVDCFFKGIKFGKRTYYMGKSLFVRERGSSISVGDACVFNSYYKFNLIGINRACLISTSLNDAKIEIGNNCGFSGTVIGAYKYIKIGNNVKCGANTLITDSDWHLDDPRSGPPKEVIIGNNVWLGEGVKVLKGVHIGENALIGAGSVVTKDIPANAIAAGNPCRIIKLF